MSALEAEPANDGTLRSLRLIDEDGDMEKARAALRRLRLWDGVSPLSLRRLSGAAQSNLTIEARGETGHFALRLPCDDVGGVIDRAAEREAEAIAWRLAIGAEPAGFDEATGITATRWVENAIPLTGALLRDDPARLEQIAALLRRLHRSGAIFQNALDLRAVVAAYRARLPASDLATFWTPVIERAVDGALQAMTREAAPCHGDVTPANILLTSDSLRLIDWEYAAMADPAWDLGYLACEASLDERGLARFVAGYRDKAMTVARAREAMLAAAAVSTLWSLLRLRALPSPETESAFPARRDMLLTRAAQA